MLDITFASELCKFYVENYDNLNCDIKNELYNQIIHDIFHGLNIKFYSAPESIICGYKIYSDIELICISRYYIVYKSAKDSLHNFNEMYIDGISSGCYESKSALVYITKSLYNEIIDKTKLSPNTKIKYYNGLIVR